MNMLRAAARAIRALTLLSLLAAVIVGLPWGLWHFFGPPLGGRVPRYDDITTWLDRSQLSPDLAALRVLDIAACGYWVLFTAQIAIQLPGVAVDTARAVRARAPLSAEVHSNLAGRLLIAIAISIVATRGTVAAASVATGSDGSVPVTPNIVAEATATDRLYVVVEGDSLWDIAEKVLGDPQRWKDIYELNRHRVQSDGDVLADPEVIRPGWTFVLPTDVGMTAAAPAPVQVTVPQQLEPAASEASASPIIAAPPVSSSSTRSAASIPQAYKAPSVARRPVAVHLPTGGYVSLTLGAGLAAALAAASVRSRVNGRRRAIGAPHPEVERHGELEASLLQAAATIGYGRDAESDPYIDDPADGNSPVPQALTALRAPIAVYIGNRHGRPIPFQAVAVGGLGLVGDGAHDAARALLVSALSAGGFLAGSAVYQVITTTDDLQTLTGIELEGDISDRLRAYSTLEGSLAAISALTTNLSPQRPLLLASIDTTTVLNSAMLGETEAVLLGCPDAATVAEIDIAGTITARGSNAQALDGGQSYQLSLAEARALVERMLAAAPSAETEVVAPDNPGQPDTPTAPDPVDSAVPKTEAVHFPEPSPTTVDLLIPSPASGANPVASEAAISVNILGPLQVKAAGRDVTALFRPLTAAILIQLALNPRGIIRSILAADLWPEPNLDPDARTKRFKATLSHVRTALAEAHGAKADHIREARPARILTLNPNLIAVDAWRFDELLDTAGSAAHATALLEAIELHRGPVALGHEQAEPNRNTDEAWLTPHREVYFRKLIDAHTDAAKLLRATNPDRAIDLLERAVELEPWNHALSEQIIEIHVEQGRPHAAARRLAILTDHLAHLGMRPSPGVVTLVGPVPAG